MMKSRKIQLTSAAFDYGNLNISCCGRDFFPSDVYGKASRSNGTGVLITLELEGLGKQIKTDIPTDRKTGKPRWIFRERKNIKEFIRYHKLEQGEEVIITRLDERKYSLGLMEKRLKIDLFEQLLTPVHYSQKVAEQYIVLTKTEYRKERGQYFTPPEVANFMAMLGSEVEGPYVRVLDPGAGAGILSCAVCEQLAKKKGMEIIEIHAFENDPELIKILNSTFTHTSNWLRERGIRLKSHIYDKDFLLAAPLMVNANNFQAYDLVISNPPYFKISADDPRAQAFPEVIYGQPNIYSIFMEASANLLKNLGSLVFITPRSYSAGNYFKNFRQVFFRKVTPIRVHLFESRKDVFAKQSVLQESLILLAKKGGNYKNIVISSSYNNNRLDGCAHKKVFLPHVLKHGKSDIIFRIPVDHIDDLIIDIIDSWTENLEDYDLRISTGPVVPFRAADYISGNGQLKAKNTVPLLWMQNVQLMKTVWPCNGRKNRKASHQFIIDNEITRKRKLLVPNQNMVLVRRFSAKEQNRRLTAAPLFQSKLKYAVIGIENHLNYIYRPNGAMSSDETEGLAAIFNSYILDRYFRICNGNTQVGATEIKSIPLPPYSIVDILGRKLRGLTHIPTIEMVDKYFFSILETNINKKDLFKELKIEAYRGSKNNP